MVFGVSSICACITSEFSGASSTGNAKETYHETREKEPFTPSCPLTTSESKNVVKLNLIFQIRNPEIRGSTSTIQPRLEWPAWSVVPCRSRTARKDPDRTDGTCKTQPQLLQDCPWLFRPQVTPITRFVPIVIGCRSWKSIAFGFDRPTIIGKPLRPQQRFVSWSAFGRGIWCWRNFFVKLFDAFFMYDGTWATILGAHLLLENSSGLWKIIKNRLHVSWSWNVGLGGHTLLLLYVYNYVECFLAWSGLLSPWFSQTWGHLEATSGGFIDGSKWSSKSNTRWYQSSSTNVPIIVSIFLERKCLPPCQD